MRSLLAWLIAIVPIFPPIYLLAFYFLRYWKAAGPILQKIFIFYFSTQIIAAALAPNPTLSILLAILRSLFIFSLILTGIYLKSKEWLYYLLYGLLFVYILAFWTTWHVYGDLWWHHRLAHPYYTSVSVGVAAAVGLLLILSWTAKWWVKLPLVFLALAALLFSGSRGALALLLVGLTLAILATEQLRSKWLIIGGVLSTTIYTIFSLGQNIPSLGHLLSLNLSSRDRVWQGALEAIRSHPLGGVGPYQLGPWLTLGAKKLFLWTGARALGFKEFPAWTKSIYGSWLIAHNLLLHSLGETGIIGTVGFFILLSLLGYAAFRSREPLLVAIFFGYLAMSLVDNPMAVPSLFFAEVFWVAGGMALVQAGLAVPIEQGLTVDQDQLGPDAL